MLLCNVTKHSLPAPAPAPALQEASIQKPLITVVRRGAPGYAFVQTVPFAVTESTFVLVPASPKVLERPHDDELQNPAERDYRRLARAFIAAAAIDPVRMRCSYGTPLMPEVLSKLMTMSDFSACRSSSPDWWA